jgi:hypothetical protein
MNKAQRVIIVIGLILVILAALFPPYEGEWRPEGTIFKAYMGYRFFFAPPSQRDVYEAIMGKSGVTVDQSTLSMYNANIVISRLCVQDLTIVIATLGLLLLLGAKRKE